MRIILLLFLAFFLKAETLSATYIAKYGLLGTVAKAGAVMETNETAYKIYTETKTLGLVASLSKHMVQTYVSIGKIKNGVLIPDYYVAIRTKDNYISKRVYIFDHKNKKIRRLKYRNGKLETNTTLPYYCKDDVLTLYFNLSKYVKNYNDSRTFYALGGRKGDGRIDVSFPKGEELENLRDDFDNEKGIYIKADLYNKIFVGDKGVLYLVINPQHWITMRAMVKNVLKIGDLKGKIKSFRLIP